MVDELSARDLQQMARRIVDSHRRIIVLLTQMAGRDKSSDIPTTFVPVSLLLQELSGIEV